MQMNSRRAALRAEARGADARGADARGADARAAGARAGRPAGLAFFFAAVLVLLAGCAEDPAGPGPARPIEGLPRQLTATETGLIRAGNAFAFNLLREVHAAEAPDENIFLSPLSASMALGMAMNGARGETFAAMRDVLGFAGLEQGEINRSYRTLLELLLGLDPTVAIGIANSFWYDMGLTPKAEFRAALEESFDSKFEALDFGAANAVATINAWVDAATKGRIPEILDAIGADEVAFLINAIHFKANWTQQFDKKLTRPGPFRVEGGSSRMVPMMKNDQLAFRWAHTPEVSIADIPYGGGAFSMTVLLPPEGRSLDDLLAALDAESWQQWTGLLGEQREGWLSLPKFRIEYEASLKEALAALGMGIAFTGASDFSGIFDGSLAISRVVQKTFVEVDEEGTEAAAATVVGIRTVSLPPGFAVDRSFIFALRERFSGAILFIGKVVDPEG